MNAVFVKENKKIWCGREDYQLTPDTVIMLFFKGNSERLPVRVSRKVRYLCPTEARRSPAALMR